jgi:hypothetical protein
MLHDSNSRVNVCVRTCEAVALHRARNAVMIGDAEDERWLDGLSGSETHHSIITARYGVACSLDSSGGEG